MVHDPVAREDKRDPFSAEQLKALFGASPWSPRDDSPDAKPSCFWVPLLCAFHGLRLAEAAGLLVEHVSKREGTPVLLLKAYEGRGLKTNSSRGVLPVHPELIHMGFLKYVRECRTAGAERLFPDAKVNANGKVGAKLGEWFSKLVKERGLKGTKLGMHSFRHSFEDRLREAELPERTALALARRTERSSSGGYGDGLSVRSLAAAMAKISYPGLDLSHLHQPERAEAA
jgi:integrase